MDPVTAESEVSRFADALAWNWIVGGNDAHAKNYSLLLQGRQVRLAPLYDITSSLTYWPERKVDLAMKLGDDYALFDHRDPWKKAATTLRLDDGRLHDRVKDLCAAAPDAFATAAAAPEVVALGGHLPARLTDAVALRAADCRRLLEYGTRRASLGPDPGAVRSEARTSGRPLGQAGLEPQEDCQSATTSWSPPCHPAARGGHRRIVAKVTAWPPRAASPSPAR